MALKLAGESSDTTMRVGRWTSLTYMTYIHAQIGALAKGWHGECHNTTRFTTWGNPSPDLHSAESSLWGMNGSRHCQCRGAQLGTASSISMGAGDTMALWTPV